MHTCHSTAAFRDEAEVIAEVVNFAQTSKSHGTKKVAALKDSQKKPQSALYEGEGGI
jgi:hypothetical protein